MDLAGPTRPAQARWDRSRHPRNTILLPNFPYLCHSLEAPAELGRVERQPEVVLEEADGRRGAGQVVQRLASLGLVWLGLGGATTGR